jgi:hypothetical protein
VAAARKGGGHHRTGSTASAAATSVTTGPAESVLGGEEGKEAAESLADVFVEVLRGERAGRQCGSKPQCRSLLCGLPASVQHLPHVLAMSVQPTLHFL